MEKLKSIDDFKRLKKELSEKIFRKDTPRAHVCCGTACAASGSHGVANALEDAARDKGLDITLIRTGCQGMCQQGPNIKLEPAGYYYQRARPDQAREIIESSIKGNSSYRRGLYRDDILSEPVESMDDLPFYKKQLRIALRNNDVIDPSDISQYIVMGGYGALRKAFEYMKPEDVLDEIDRADLRGRGGAGFPAGKKWKHTRAAKGLKVVVANGDEGDPGAFMDRAIMEGDPHSLLEGMLLCAYAIGARYGLIYVRHEYPLAVKNLKHAIRTAESLGLLGENIFSTNFSFGVDIREGAGAFACGESTALIASIEGERGFPRPRPPRLSEQGGGVWGYATNLNNIETYACVAPIIENGSKWFRSIGTETSPGTKVFAITGKVKNTGLVEVPMGITLREIIFDIGGGIIGDKQFKAVQTGGPSGGCIPAQHLDSPVDFDSLAKLGSIMGSGGMVVLDEDTCMVDVARYFLSFTQSESCGKCPPCRIGTYQMLQILERITSGEGRHGDIETLISLGKKIQEGSLCGLGQSAPNPVLSTIKYFRQEFEEHIYDNYCRSNACKNMGVFAINPAECVSCGLCKDACAYNAVVETRKGYYIDRAYCVKCKACHTACPVGAVKIRRQSVSRLEDQFRIPAEDIEILARRARMILKDVVRSKPIKVVTCKKDCKVADAVTIMDGNNVGSILVFDDTKQLAGIFTERDIMHCFAKNISFVDVPIGSVMTPQPITLDASTDIGVAVNVMSEKKIRHLPVTENEEIIGMISYRDIVSYLLPEVIFMAEDIY
ncbi:MAG: CBS domain-containing protein [Nitrospiraceae bacterium]|nr:CBS domain-containing protein [Nitrospiraceae bacterium]